MTQGERAPLSPPEFLILASTCGWGRGQITMLSGLLQIDLFEFKMFHAVAHEINLFAETNYFYEILYIPNP